MRKAFPHHHRVFNHFPFTLEFKALTVAILSASDRSTSAAAALTLTSADETGFP